MRMASRPGRPAGSASDLWAEPDDRGDLRRRRKNGRGLRVAALVLACVAAGYYGWWSTQRDGDEPTASRAVETEPAPTAEPADQGTRFPLGPAPADALAGAGGIAASLQALLGREAFGSLVVLDQFPRRLVATIDNLGREHAPVALWPVQRPADRFVVASADDTAFISPANARRYEPWVDLLAGLDPEAAAGWYRRVYPLLQQAYGELGFGDRYFNDRVVEVIDLLLATPTLEGPVPVKLMQVRGPVASLQPWTRYEFADPQFEALPAGQKILLRLTPLQQQQVKHKLRQLRAEIAAGR